MNWRVPFATGLCVFLISLEPTIYWTKMWLNRDMYHGAVATIREVTINSGSRKGIWGRRYSLVATVKDGDVSLHLPKDDPQAKFLATSATIQLKVLNCDDGSRLAVTPTELSTATAHSIIFLLVEFLSLFAIAYAIRVARMVNFS